MDIRQNWRVYVHDVPHSPLPRATKLMLPGYDVSMPPAMPFEYQVAVVRLAAAAPALLAAARRLLDAYGGDTPDWLADETHGLLVAIDLADDGDDDDGCPKGDPDCLGRNGDCHDSCVAPIDPGADDIASVLADPVAVHRNMLAGRIAKPGITDLIHLYGADALREALRSTSGVHA